MEKAFRLGKESKIYNDYQKYLERVNYQKQCIFEFLKKNGVEAKKYYVTANGRCNCHFDEYDKKDIRLGIIATDKDNEKLKNMLLKPDKYDICMLRKNSKLNKQFQDYAIEMKFVINILRPDMRDYFKSLGWYGYSSQIAVDKYKNWYLKISSEALKDNDLPDGLIEIKISEFYAIKESEVEQ